MTLKKMRGRPRKMDREATIRAAMNVFWAKGYAESSVDELLVAAGAKTASFYAAFGSKKGLFIETLAKFKSDVVLLRRQTIESAPNAREGIKSCFAYLIDQAVSNPGTSLGCLFINTAVEVGSKDEEISGLIRDAMLDWERYWLELIRRGQTRGELVLVGDMTPEQAASLLVSVTTGLTVLSKVNPNRQFLEAHTTAMLAVFGQPSRPAFAATHS